MSKQDNTTATDPEFETNKAKTSYKAEQQQQTKWQQKEAIKKQKAQQEQELSDKCRKRYSNGYRYKFVGANICFVNQQLVDDYLAYRANTMPIGELIWRVSYIYNRKEFFFQILWYLIVIPLIFVLVAFLCKLYTFDLEDLTSSYLDQLSGVEFIYQLLFVFKLPFWTDLPFYALAIYGIYQFFDFLIVMNYRLHDTNHSGMYLYLLLFPVVGWLILLRMLLAPSNYHNNPYLVIDEYKLLNYIDKGA